MNLQELKFSSATDQIRIFPILDHKDYNNKINTLEKESRSWDNLIGLSCMLIRILSHECATIPRVKNTQKL